MVGGKDGGNMCGCYNVAISTSINEGLLFSGVIQDEH